MTRYLGTYGQRRVRAAALLAPLPPFQNSFHAAIRVSAAAALGCAAGWREDFRADVARIAVPVLIVRGERLARASRRQKTL